MKYYFAALEEVHGEHGFDTIYVFATADDPTAICEQLAQKWLGGDPSFDEEYGGYYTDGVVVKNLGWREVSKEDYDVLSRYICPVPTESTQ